LVFKELCGRVLYVTQSTKKARALLAQVPHWEDESVARIYFYCAESFGKYPVFYQDDVSYVRGNIRFTEGTSPPSSDIVVVPCESPLCVQTREGVTIPLTGEWMDELYSEVGNPLPKDLVQKLQVSIGNVDYAKLIDRGKVLLQRATTRVKARIVRKT